MSKSEPRGESGGHSKKLKLWGDQVAAVDDGNIDNDSRNPMLNTVVLTRLFEVCSLSDLPRFRLVSKQWHSLSLTRFRNEMTVFIQPPEGARLFESQQLYFEKGLDWDDGMDRKLDVGERKPFRTFCLYDMEFDNLSKREEDAANGNANESLAMMYRNMRLFFTKYGPSIRKLKLWKPHVAILEEFKTAIFDCVPNLEELILVDLGTTTTAISNGEEGVRRQPNLNMKRLILKGLGGFSGLGNFVLQIPNQFPNIQKVEVDMSHEDGQDGLSSQNTLPMLELISEKINKTNVQFIVSHMRLKWHPLFTDRISNATRALELPHLTVLKINIEIELWWRTGDAKLRTFVSTLFRLHGHTLKELGLTVRSCYGIRPHKDFPFCPGAFTSLRGLTLSGEYWRNLHFLRQFPNLETLKIGHCDQKILDKTTSRGMRGVRLKNLREFSFSSGGDWYSIPNEKMEILVEVMPNVKAFEVGDRKTHIFL